MYALLTDTDELVNGEPVQVYRKQKAEVINGIQYPRNWWTAYSLAEKAAIHVFPLARPFGNTDGTKEETGTYTYSFDGTEVLETPVLQDRKIEQVVDEKYNELTAYAESQGYSGFIHGGKIYKSDERAIGQIGLLYAGHQSAPFSAGFGYRTRDNKELIPLETPAKRKAFADDLVRHLDQVQQCYDEHILYITNPGLTLEDAVAYDPSQTITKPWPNVPETDEDLATTT